MSSNYQLDYNCSVLGNDLTWKTGLVFKGFGAEDRFLYSRVEAVEIESNILRFDSCL